jgi:hypothetical protein
MSERLNDRRTVRLVLDQLQRRVQGKGYGPRPLVQRRTSGGKVSVRRPVEARPDQAKLWSLAEIGAGYTAEELLDRALISSGAGYPGGCSPSSMRLAASAASPLLQRSRTVFSHTCLDNVSRSKRDP